MELRGTCNSVGPIEDIIKVLVKAKRAEQIYPIANSGLFGNTDSPVFIHKYQVLVKPQGFLGHERVNVRFWFDHREDRASMKITYEGWELIMRDFKDLIKAIQTANLEIIGNGQVKKELELKTHEATAT